MTVRIAPQKVNPPEFADARDGGLGYDDLIRDPGRKLYATIPSLDDVIEGDLLTLYWDDTPVSRYTVIKYDGPSYTFPVQVADIINAGGGSGSPPLNGEHALFYTILTSLGNDEIKSPVTTVLVKTTLPGGPDTNPETPNLNERLSVPTVSPDEIDNSTPEAIVTVKPWENMAAGDVLTVNWNGYFVNQQPLTDLQVGLEVKVIIGSDVIKAAGDGESLPVNYQIRDQVNNWSLWSPYAFANVDTGSTNTLAAPLVLSASYEGDDDGVIDLDELGDDDISVAILRYAGMAVNDSILLTWRGVTPAGLEIVRTVFHQVVKAVPQLLLELPNEAAKLTAGGTASVFYSVTAGSSVRASKRTPISVVGEAKRLPAPAVMEANNGVLDPDDTKSGAHAIIPPWEGMAFGDTVTLYWQGKTATGTPTQYTRTLSITSGNVGKSVKVGVPANEVERLNQGSATLFYEVNTYDVNVDGVVRLFTTLPASEKLTLAVRRRGEEPYLPAPIIAEVKDGLLDPATVPFGTEVMLPHYDGMTKGDLIEVLWDADGSTMWQDVVRVQTPGEQFLTVEAELIKSCLNKNVVVRYEVTRSQGGRVRSNALTFRVGTALMLLPAPSVLEAAGGEVAAELSIVSVIVPENAALRRGDRLTVLIKGPVSQRQVEQVLESDQQMQILVQFKGAEVLLPNADSTVNISYTVLRDAKETVSEGYALKVRPELPVPGELEAPMVPELRSGVLPGDTVVATVVVPASAGLYNGERVIITWVTLTSGDELEYEVPVTLTGGALYYKVPAEAIVSSRGSQVAVFYTLHRRGTDYKSSLLLFKVENESGRDMPPPLVQEAVGGAVPEGVDVHMVVPAAANLKAGEVVRAVLHTYPQEAVIVPGNGAGNELILTLTASEVGKLIGAGSQPWKYQIYINGNWQDSESVNILVKAKSEGLIIDFEDIPLQKLIDKQPIRADWGYFELLRNGFMGTAEIALALPEANNTSGHTLLLGHAGWSNSPAVYFYLNDIKYRKIRFDYTVHSDKHLAFVIVDSKNNVTHYELRGQGSHEVYIPFRIQRLGFILRYDGYATIDNIELLRPL